MPQIIQFSAPYRVDVVERAPSPVPAGHVRVRTRYSGISSGTELTVDRGSNPCLNRRWDPYSRLFVGLVTHVLPIREALAAYDLLHQRPEDAMQIVLEF